MPTLASYRAPAGLSVPIVTIMDSKARILEEEQRSLVRFVLQDGMGANVIFAVGTTGEWNRLDNPRQQAVARIVVDECRRREAGQGPRHDPVEVWVGITAHTRAETLDNLRHAIDIRADAAVVAPLSIVDAADPVEFVSRDIANLFEQRGATIPVFLYDNADIAAAGRPPHLRTRDVKRMSRLDYVQGIKVTASKAVLGNYTRAGSHLSGRASAEGRGRQFAIYAGNPVQIFDLFAAPEGFAGALRNYWNRYWTRNALPHGIVAGQANVMVREWRRAWQVCQARDSSLMKSYAEILGQFDGACRLTRGGSTSYPVIACLKAALVELGVCASAAVAPGTPSLDDADRREFIGRFRDLRERALARLEREWVSKSGNSTQVPEGVAGHA